MADKKFSEFTDGGEVKVSDQVVGLRSSNNYRFDFPGAGLKDASGNYILQYATVGASAINYPLLINSIAGQPITLQANGADVNIGINFDTKGSGLVYINASAGVGSIIDDDSMATASATSLATSESIKAYVDAQVVADSGLSWNNLAATSVNAVVNNGYVIANAGLTTVTLPTTAAVGALVAIQGQGAAGWVLTAGAGQTIKIGSSTTSTAGSLASTNQYDSIEIICIVANTTWGTRFSLSSGLTVT